MQFNCRQGFGIQSIYQNITRAPPISIEVKLPRIDVDYQVRIRIIVDGIIGQPGPWLNIHPSIKGNQLLVFVYWIVVVFSTFSYTNRPRFGSFSVIRIEQKMMPL